MSFSTFLATMAVVFSVGFGFSTQAQEVIDIETYSGCYPDHHGYRDTDLCPETMIELIERELFFLQLDCERKENDAPFILERSDPPAWQDTSVTMAQLIARYGEPTSCTKEMFSDEYVPCEQFFNYDLSIGQSFLSLTRSTGGLPFSPDAQQICSASVYGEDLQVRWNSVPCGPEHQPEYPSDEECSRLEWL